MDGELFHYCLNLGIYGERLGNETIRFRDYLTDGVLEKIIDAETGRP